MCVPTKLVRHFFSAHTVFCRSFLCYINLAGRHIKIKFIYLSNSYPIFLLHKGTYCVFPEEWQATVWIHEAGLDGPLPDPV